MRLQDFRRLHVWERAHAFAVDVRRVVKTFPAQGYADLRSQLSRAAESIVHNIVEGCASASRKEFAHHLNVSIKSSAEVDYQLELARDYHILPYDVWKRLAQEVIEIRKMLTALRRAVLRSIEENESEEASPPNQEPRKPGRSQRGQRKPNKRNRKKNPEETGPSKPETGPSKPEETGPDA